MQSWLDDPVVEALEPRREQRELGLGGELLDERLVELPSLWRERDDAARALRRRTRPRARRRRRRRGAPSRSAAVRVVVHLPRAKWRRIAVVEEPQLELAAEHRREGLLLRQPGEGVRNLREDVDAHGRPRVPLGLGETLRAEEEARDDDDPPGLDDRPRGSRPRSGGRACRRRAPRCRSRDPDAPSTTSTEVAASFLGDGEARRAGRRSSCRDPAAGDRRPRSARMAPRSTLRSSRIGAPAACRRDESTRPSPATRRRAPSRRRPQRRSSSLASSTTNEPSRPCGRADPADRHELVGQRQSAISSTSRRSPRAPADAHDRPQRSRDAALPPDHLPDVVGRAVEAQDDDVALVDAARRGRRQGRRRARARSRREARPLLPTRCRRP